MMDVARRRRRVGSIFWQPWKVITTTVVGTSTIPTTKIKVYIFVKSLYDIEERLIPTLESIKKAI